MSDDNHSDARTARAASMFAAVAAKGLPALRAALHGARLGAGRAFGPAVVEQLGVAVVPAVAARAMGSAIQKGAGEVAVVFRRGAAVLRAGREGIAVHARDGLSLGVGPRGAAVAGATPEAVSVVARTTARGALAGIGRAAMQGAAAGAVVDGALAGVGAVRAVARGAMTRGEAVRHVGRHTARGAVAGAAGVAAAGAVSAGIAATGFAVLGAPVALPLVTMVAVGTVAGHVFDRYFPGKTAAGDQPAGASFHLRSNTQT